MQVLSFWIALGVTNYVLVITLVGMGRSREVLFQAVPQFFVMLGSCVVLMPLYQGMGAASSLAITSVVGNLTSCWMLVEGNRWLFLRLCWVFLKPAFVLFILLIFVLKTSQYSLHLLAFPATIALFYLLRVVSIRDWLALTKQIQK
jgi:O-antigen/teichoic acid export membrane protein